MFLLSLAPALRGGLLAVVIVAGLGVAMPLRAESADLGADLHALLAHALSTHPAIDAAIQDAEAARARVEAAGSHPDPRFQLELMDATNAMSGRGASLLPGQVGTTRYRIIQPLPYPGKLDLRTEMARAGAGGAGAMLDDARIVLASRVKRAFAQHYLAGEQAWIIRENLELLDALEPIVLTRYGVGIVPQQDAIQVQSEITRLRVDLVDAQRRRLAAAARLNATLVCAADAPLATPSALPPVPAHLPLAELRARLHERSPVLARLRAGAAAADASRALTYRDRYPDMAIGLTNNRPRDGVDSWDLMFEVTIPLQQSARRAREREAERSFEAAESRVEAALSTLEGQLGEAWAGFESSGESARLLRDTLLPQAQAAYAAAEAGYETGRVNFNTLIEAERRILSTRLALLNAEVERFERLIDLEQMTGVSL
jgi:outer membrane protein TolC